MKKLIYIIVTICAFSAIFTGCVRDTTADRGETMFPDGVSLVLEHSTYPADVESINVVWRNDSNRGIEFNAGHGLQRKVGDQWEAVKPIRDRVMFLAIYVVSPHSQRDYEYWINLDYGVLEAGEYRIAVSFSESSYQIVTDPSETIEPYDRTNSYPAYAEFTVA